MSLILVAVLIIGATAGVIALAVGIPFFVGILTYDVVESRKLAPAKPVVVESEAPMRIAVERGIARAFVVAGGAFWSVAVFAGLRFYGETGLGNSLLAAFFPLVAVLATLVVGWYYERVASALLAAASLAVVAWGVIFQFEAGVWALMAFALIGPMMTASVLFWLARRDQEAFELSLATQAELARVAAEG